MSESRPGLLDAAQSKRSWAKRAFSRPVKFLMAGGFAAAVNFLSRILLGRWMPYVPSIVVAFLFGITTAFVMNRLFVFNNAKNALHSQIFWFAVVNLAAVAQTIAISLLLADIVFPGMGFAWHSETVAHAFGVLAPVLTSYVGHKHLSFKGSADA